MFGFKVLAATALLAQGILAEGIHFFDCRSWHDASTPIQSFTSVVAVCLVQAEFH